MIGYCTDLVLAGQSMWVYALSAVVIGQLHKTPRPHHMVSPALHVRRAGSRRVAAALLSRFVCQLDAVEKKPASPKTMDSSL